MDSPMDKIDWVNPYCAVSKYFTVHECLWLPSWGRMATEEDGLNEDAKEGIFEFASKMDVIRDFFDKPINVHVCFRPAAYNKQIGGATHSAHIARMVDSKRTIAAMDYDVEGMNCDEVRAALVPKLSLFRLRMEKNPGGNWIHNDSWVDMVSSDSDWSFWP